MVDDLHNELYVRQNLHDYREIFPVGITSCISLDEDDMLEFNKYFTKDIGHKQHIKTETHRRSCVSSNNHTTYTLRDQYFAMRNHSPLIFDCATSPCGHYLAAVARIPTTIEGYPVYNTALSFYSTHKIFGHPLLESLQIKGLTSPFGVIWTPCGKKILLIGTEYPKIEGCRLSLLVIHLERGLGANNQNPKKNINFHLPQIEAFLLPDIIRCHQSEISSDRYIEIEKKIGGLAPVIIGPKYINPESCNQTLIKINGGSLGFVFFVSTDKMARVYEWKCVDVTLVGEYLFHQEIVAVNDFGKCFLVATENEVSALSYHSGEVTATPLIEIDNSGINHKISFIASCASKKARTAKVEPERPADYDYWDSGLSDGFCLIGGVDWASLYAISGSGCSGDFIPVYTVNTKPASEEIIGLHLHARPGFLETTQPFPLICFREKVVRDNGTNDLDAATDGSSSCADRYIMRILHVIETHEHPRSHRVISRRRRETLSPATFIEYSYNLSDLIDCAIPTCRNTRKDDENSVSKLLGSDSDQKNTQLCQNNRLESWVKNVKLQWFAPDSPNFSFRILVGDTILNFDTGVSDLGSLSDEDGHQKQTDQCVRPNPYSGQWHTRIANFQRIERNVTPLEPESLFDDFAKAIEEAKNTRKIRAMPNKPTRDMESIKGGESEAMKSGNNNQEIYNPPSHIKSSFVYSFIPKRSTVCTAERAHPGPHRIYSDNLTISILDKEKFAEMRLKIIDGPRH